MEAIFLLLADDHPLIRAGFRGRLRLLGGLEVRILGNPPSPEGRRSLPRHKRRAMLLIASGCGPFELAERMGICLERAEAIHEELSKSLGLDQIARQVRSAIRAGEGRPGGDIVRPVTDTAGAPDSRGDRMMDDIDLVRSLFPDSLARSAGDGSWAVIVDPAGDAHRLGEGRSASEAWASATARLSLDDWFRPIIAQLRAMRSERGSGA